MSDSDIRVTIRSGTSTQRIDREFEERYFREMYNMRDVYLYEIQYELLEMPDDTGFDRNPYVRLDIKKRSCKESETMQECSICQNKFNVMENVCTLECKHIFHYECIKRWGEYKQDCPLCRKEIPVLER